MDKKIIKISFEVLFILLCVFLVLQNTSLFINTTNRLKSIIDYKNIKTFFEIYDQTKLNQYHQNITNKVLNIITYLFDENISLIDKLNNLLLKIINLLLDIIINFTNIGLNIILLISVILHEEFTKEVEKIKYTKGAIIYLKINNFLNLIIKQIKISIHKLIIYLKHHKKIIALHLLLILLSNGILYRIIVETIIFIEVYLIRLFNYELYILFLRLFSYLFIHLYPFIIKLPKPILIIIFLIFIYFSAYSRANYRLKMNHERLKKFAKDDITQTTFINGPPGCGKTLLNSALTLISEENYLDELEEKMLDYEINYPQENFALVREKKTNKHLEYFKYYSLERNRKTFITSNYSIYSPYFMAYSKIFDFDNMRKNKQNDKYALEEYIVISLSELDKEYNSHDNMKEVGEDGVSTFFSTISHDLKRHVKIFCDYQLKDQVPLRIRGNAEYFYTIESRKKKYPFLLYLYYLPFLKLDELLKKYLQKYESIRKSINKKTQRKTISKIKRNDFSFIYALLRHLAYINKKICTYFDHFWYFKIKGNLSTQDGIKGDIKTLNLNICDLEINQQKLYDSTFLSYAYETKKNYSFKDLDTFTSLTPSIEELNKCHSRFYNKINGNNLKQDEIIDL